MSRDVLAIIGVGPGLGLSIAKRFAREGFAISMIARRPDALDEYASALPGAPVCGVAADAGTTESLTEALAQAEMIFGPPSVLVYNAAVLRARPILSLDPEDLVSELRVHVAGALTAAQKVVPAMRERGRGTILFTGGGLALTPAPQLASLAVGKAGLRNLTLSLAAELEPHGIHVATVTICGLIKPDTPFAPERLADEFWHLHAQPREAWERERIR